MENLTAHGPVTPVDMDLMCAKLSWDIIGKVAVQPFHAAVHPVQGNVPYCCLASKQFQEHEITARRLQRVVCHMMLMTNNMIFTTETTLPHLSLGLPVVISIR